MKIYSNSEANKELLKIFKAKNSHCVEVLDNLSNETKLYYSISEAALAIGLNHSTICNAFRDLKLSGK